MSTNDLKEKETGIYDDGNPSWYKPSKDAKEVKDLEDSFNSPPASDKHLPSGHPSKSEKNQDKEEGQSLNKGGKSKSSKKKPRFSRKQKGIYGSILAIFSIGGFGIMSFMSFPFLPIHASQLLQNSSFGINEFSGRSRAGKLIRYMRTSDSPERRNMTFLANQVADRYQGRLRQAGIEVDFGRDSGRQARTIQSFRVDTTTPQGQEFLRAVRAGGIEPTIVGNTATVNIEGGGRSAQGRSAISAAVRTLGLNSASSALGTRLLKVRANVSFRPLTNSVRDSGERLRNFITRRNQEVSQDVRAGAQQSQLTIEGGTQESADGTRTADPAGTEISEDLNNARSGDTATTRQNLRSYGARGAGVAGLVCLAKGVYDVRQAIIIANVMMPLMRIGVGVIAAGDQIRYGEGISNDEVARAHDAFYDEETGTHFMSADPMLALQGLQPVGNTMPDYAHPASATEKPAMIQAIDDIPGIDDVCTTFVGQAVLTILGGVTEIAVTGALLAIEQATGTDPLGAVVEWAARGLAGEEIDGTPTGALYGVYAAYGSRLAARDAMTAVGGRELSPQEESTIAQAAREMYIAEHQSKPLMDRLFDITDHRSLSSRVYIALHRNSALSNKMPQTVAMAPINIIGNVFSGSVFLNSFSAAVGASSYDYDYGFPMYGFSIEELEGVAESRFGGANTYDLDPFENADVLEANEGAMLRRLNDEYGECFNTTINPDNGRIETVADVADTYSEDEDRDQKCNNPNNLELLRYRLYLLDQTTVKALACLELIDEEACRDIGM